MTPLQATSHPVFDYCRKALPKISRTFALTIPILREPLRSEVTYAYVMCRFVDTIEDHPSLTPEARDPLLTILGELLHQDDPAVWARFLEACPRHEDSDHDELLRRGRELFAARGALDPGAANAVTRCVEEMISGMLEFPGAAESEVVSACANMDDLDRYCHAVAGTVGHLLCRLFARFVPDPEWLDSDCAERGRRLGLGLQLTNILKDREGDSTRGVCYIPASHAEAPLSSTTEFQVATVDSLVEHALDHLREGHSFILGIRQDQTDLRLFCLLAHHLALATLAVIADPSGARPPKITRDEVAHRVLACREAAGSNDRVDALYHDLENGVRECLSKRPRAGF